MVTKEPKSEKTTGRATTKKATAAQPETSKEGTETTVTSKTKATSKATTGTTKAKSKAVAADAAETTVTSVTLTNEIPVVATAPATTSVIASEPAPAGTGQTVSEDEIAKQAYILWLERGCPHGDSAQDWFTAIRLLEQV